jgi:CheY-like chemotaxis protein
MGYLAGGGMALTDTNLTDTKQRVLVVENDKDTGESLKELLAEMGFDVHLVQDGESAVLAVPQVCPSIVIMDVGLPGIDGYEATRQIRKIDAGRSALVVALTGYGEIQDIKKAADCGMDNFLTKPVSPQQLVKGLARYD